MHKYYNKPMKKYAIILICTILNTLLCQQLFGTENYLFKQYSTTKGFPTSVQTIYAESKGYVWIGTPKGLGRFDGYNLKMYVHISNNEHSIPGNLIYQIIEDSQKHIWILTNFGITQYNELQDNFKSIKDPHTQQNIKATAACCIGKDLIFITAEYIYSYNPESQAIIRKIPIEYKPFTFQEIWKWDNSTLLCINKWRGIFMIDLNTGKFKPSPLNDKNISKAIIDSQERVWTTSYNEGITCYNKKGEIIDSFNTKNSSLSHDVILCLSEHKGKIWAGTDGGGINIINPETKNIKTLSHISGDKNSLPVNTIQCICHSQNIDNCWIGTVKGGFINIIPTFIQTYIDVPVNSKNGLTEKAILSFYQEPTSNEIWIGTDGGGINKFTPKEQKFKHYANANNQKEKVVALCNYNNNELLVSIFSKGLFIFNKHTGKLRPIQKDISEIEQMARYSRKSIGLYQDDTSSVLIFTPTILRYYFKSGKITYITPPDKKMEAQTVGIGHDSLYTYIHDSKCIYSIDRTNNQISTIYTINKHNEIRCVAKDEQGILWVGDKTGVFSYNLQNKKKQRIQTIQSSHIRSLACDKNNRIWIGTDDKLLVWFIHQQQLIYLDESDGTTPNEYLNKAVLISHEGEVYMGGVNGMLRISQQRLKPYSPENITITLTDIINHNKSLLPFIDKNNHITLCPKDNMVTLQVMAHEDNILRKKKYRWQIHGPLEQNIETEGPELTLRGLAPGYYHTTVSCHTRTGEWTTPCPLITLIVPPAWYQSWWFILLVTMILSLILILAIIYILKRKEARVEMAIKEHKQKIYEEKVRFLININHELRTPLTLIHTPLNMLIKQTNTDNPLYPTLQNMLKQSHRMKNLLNMVLNLRKMEMVTNTLNIQPYALNKWIQEVGSDFVFAGEEKGIHISYQLDERIEEVEFDKESHLIILTNLITNAFKHSPLNGTILISTRKDDSHHSVHIAVKDQGNGLQEEDINHLFTRFYQGKDEKEGSGIGLSYAKILVEQHHGHIGAANNEGKGACFFYELPIKQKETGLTDEGKDYLNNCLFPECENEDKTYIPIACDVDTRNYSCLFVDDSEDLRNLAVETLKDQFQNLYIAADGKEGLQIAMSEIPDIIISDIMMPHVNGYELCRRIKENMNINHIQVILLTARIDEQSHLDGYRIGADAYLEKPFETSMLLETVRNRLFLRETIRKRYLHTPVSLIHEKPLQSADDTFLFKLNRLIIDHMSDNELNIMFLCQEMGMSRASLYNKLKPLTDMSPNEYINKIRMESAMEMLRQSDLNITEIAEKTGFSSSRYFSTAFKKFTGITPSQYKEQQK